jgi:hypothetical protein
LLTLAVLPATAPAQLTTAAIEGLVLDPTGAVIPGATVTVAGEGTVLRVTATTNARGEFTVPFLPAGRYTIGIETPGFKTLQQTNLELVVGEKVRRNFTLELGAVGETVTVTAAAPLVNAVNAQQDVNFSSLDVRELPLARRDLNNLLNLGTGLVSRRDVGVSMNGLPPRGFLFTIDGVNAAGDAEESSLGMYQDFNIIKGVTLEALEQVQVAKDIFSAETANTVGGNVNLVTKSGTNEFHGSLFYNYQSGGLNARNQFSTAPKNPSLVFNQFGGSVGGPIKKDKMFFFAAYEGYRLTAMRTQTGFMPTQELRDLAIAATPAMKTAFDIFPLPTQPSAPGADVGFYTSEEAAKEQDNHAVVRWDYNVTPTEFVSVRYKRARPNILSPRAIPVNPQTQVGVDESVAATFIHAAPTWSAETRGGYNRNDMDRTDLLYEVGVQGVSGPGFSSGPGRLFVKSGSSSTISQNFAMTRGRHSIKAGGTYQLLYVRRTDKDIPSWTYQNRAELANASPSSATYRFGVDPWQMTSWQLGGFIQDDIKISRNLMLNVGLRYDYYSVPRERDGRIFNRDGPYGPSGDPKDPNLYRDPDSIWDADYKNIAPRFSLAWRLDDEGKTVVRAGYGIFFSRQNLFSGPVELIRNGPDIPLNVSFSRQEIVRSGLEFGDGDDQALRFLTGGGLISGQLVDPRWKNPYSQQWTVGVQRELMRNLVLDVAYVGTHALKLPYSPDWNRIDRATGLRPVAGFTGFTFYQSADSSNYNALQTSLKKRFSNDLSFAINYTYASNLSYFRGNMHCCGGGDSPQDLNNLKANRAATEFYNRHVFQSHWVWELPFERLLGNGSRVSALALGGWQVSGIFSASSGDARDITQSSGIPASRPDYIGGPPILNEGLQYLNRAAFAQVPTNSASRATVRPGNLGRRAVFGPGYWYTDLALSKRLRFTERYHLQFRVDLFNALNRTHMNGYSGNITASTFGVFTSTRGARTLQMNMRLEF